MFVIVCVEGHRWSFNRPPSHLAEVRSFKCPDCGALPLYFFDPADTLLYTQEFPDFITTKPVRVGVDVPRRRLAWRCYYLIDGELWEHWVPEPEIEAEPLWKERIDDDADES